MSELTLPLHAPLQTSRGDAAERRAAVLEAECRQLSKQVRLLGARLLASEGENADLLATRADLARLQTDLAEARSVIDALRSERDSLMASTSWRLTRPGRLILTLMRGFLGGNKLVSQVHPS